MPIWDVGKLCGPLYFDVFFRCWNNNWKVLYLHCDFKNHFHIHYLIRSSGPLNINSELTFTLTNLFEESSQLNTCTWEKKVGSLPNTFWQLLSLSFSSEPTSSREEARGASPGFSRPCCPWTAAAPCLPQTAVCQQVDHWLQLPWEESHFGCFTKSKSVRQKRRLTSLGLPLGFSHRLCRVASIRWIQRWFSMRLHLPDRKVLLFLI